MSKIGVNNIAVKQENTTFKKDGRSGNTASTKEDKRSDSYSSQNRGRTQHEHSDGHGRDRSGQRHDARQYDRHTSDSQNNEKEEKSSPDFTAGAGGEKKFTGRCRLFVGNLSPDVTEDEFRKMFEEYGEISEVYVNSPRGFAFIRMDYRHNAEAAKAALDGLQRKGRALRVRFATHGAALKVKNLHPFVSNELLEQSFSQFGDLERCVVIVDDRGKPTGEGIVEFVRKPGANSALRRITEGVFLMGAEPKPVAVEPLEQKDEEDGLPEKFLTRTEQYKKEREKEPRFAPPGTFEYEFGMRWKQVEELERQRIEQIKKDTEDARLKLEDEMQNALYDYQADQIRQELVRQQEELRRLEELRKADMLRRQQDHEMRRQQDERDRAQQEERTALMMLRQQEMARARSGPPLDVMGMRGPEDFMMADRFGDRMPDRMPDRLGDRMPDRMGDRMGPGHSGFMWDEKQRVEAGMRGDPGRNRGGPGQQALPPPPVPPSAAGSGERGGPPAAAAAASAPTPGGDSQGLKAGPKPLMQQGSGFAGMGSTPGVGAPGSGGPSDGSSMDEDDTADNAHILATQEELPLDNVSQSSEPTRPEDVSSLDRPTIDHAESIDGRMHVDQPESSRPGDVSSLDRPTTDHAESIDGRMHVDQPDSLEIEQSESVETSVLLVSENGYYTSGHDSSTMFSESISDNYKQSTSDDSEFPSCVVTSKREVDSSFSHFSEISPSERESGCSSTSLSCQASKIGGCGGADTGSSKHDCSQDEESYSYETMRDLDIESCIVTSSSPTTDSDHQNIDKHAHLQQSLADSNLPESLAEVHTHLQESVVDSHSKEPSVLFKEEPVLCEETFRDQHSADTNTHQHLQADINAHQFLSSNTGTKHLLHYDNFDDSSDKSMMLHSGDLHQSPDNSWLSDPAPDQYSQHQQPENQCSTSQRSVNQYQTSLPSETCSDTCSSEVSNSHVDGTDIRVDGTDIRVNGTDIRVDGTLNCDDDDDDDDDDEDSVNFTNKSSVPVNSYTQDDSRESSQHTLMYDHLLSQDDGRDAECHHNHSSDADDESLNIEQHSDSYLVMQHVEEIDMEAADEGQATSHLSLSDSVYQGDDIKSGVTDGQESHMVSADSCLDGEIQVSEVNLSEDTLLGSQIPENEATADECISGSVEEAVPCLEVALISSRSSPASSPASPSLPAGASAADIGRMFTQGDQTFMSSGIRQSSFMPAGCSLPYVSGMGPSMYAGPTIVPGMARPTVLTSSSVHIAQHPSGATIMQHQSMSAGLNGSVAHSAVLQQQAMPNGLQSTSVLQRTLTNGGQTMLLQQRTMTTGLDGVTQQTVVQQQVAAPTINPAALFHANAMRQQQALMQQRGIRFVQTGVPLMHAQTLIPGGSTPLLGHGLLRGVNQGTMMQQLVRQRYLGGPVMPGRGVQLVAGRPIRVKMTYPRESMQMDT